MICQIPKTTLFREKTRLVEAGKLPWNSLKRRDPQSHSLNNVRLKEAVAACKDGKMSQAVASITYQVVWKPISSAFFPYKLLHLRLFFIRFPRQLSGGGCSKVRNKQPSKSNQIKLWHQLMLAILWIILQSPKVPLYRISHSSLLLKQVLFLLFLFLPLSLLDNIFNLPFTFPE